MESSDNQTQFTGTPQSESVATVPAKSKGGKGWKITAVLALIIAVGLAGGLAFFLMKSGDDSKKADDLQSSLDTKIAELNKFKEATGVDNPDDIVMSENFDFSEISGILGDNATVSLSGSYIKNSADDKFQIAYFKRVFSSESEGVSANYLFRALPDGKWKNSKFSGLAAPSCGDVVEEEKAIFAGIAECQD